MCQKACLLTCYLHHCNSTAALELSRVDLPLHWHHRLQATYSQTCWAWRSLSLEPQYADCLLSSGSACLLLGHRFLQATNTSVHRLQCTQLYTVIYSCVKITHRTVISYDGHTAPSSLAIGCLYKRVRTETHSFIHFSYLNWRNVNNQLSIYILHSI